MDVLAYFSFIVAGLLIGLFGGGGSIMIVPLLVYAFQVDVIAATAYSLLLLFVSSSIASISYYKRKLLDAKIYLLFGIPSIVSVYFTRTQVLTILPEELDLFSSFVVSRSSFIMLVFSVLMFVAALSMIRKPQYKEREVCATCGLRNSIMLIIQGLIVGFLTALVGAGGGFLIIPMLILFAKIEMKKAVGTSLMLISSQSLVGFVSTMHIVQMNWSFVAVLLVLVLTGMGVGIMLSKKIDGQKLKPAFGYFILLFSVFVIVKELI